MYKTIRMLPAALLLLLLGTACTHDPADNPAATGLPLVLEHVYIGTSTKAEPYEPGFADGSMLEATIALNGVTTEGTYRYNGTTWEQTSTTPAYWQNTTEDHTVTLRTPKPKDDMPAAFTQENWHEYDLLEYSQATTATNSFTLAHTRAQLCVMLEKGDGLTSAELAAAKVSVNGTGMLRHLNSAHYALIKPDSKVTSVEIDINGSKYPYTPDKDIPLTAGICTTLTLTLNKVGVGGFEVSSGEGWQDVTGIAAKGDFTVKECQGGDLTIAEGETKLLITGTLTSDDMTTISNAKNQITHLYIMAGAKDNDESIWKIEGFMKQSTSLQSVCITEATAIGFQAFYECGQLTNVSLPKVKSTESSVFWGCTNLVSVSLPQATTLGNNNFYGCTTLTDISLPEATTLGESFFAGCTSLASVHLPKVEGEILSRTFRECGALTDISLPKVTSIGFDVFRNCSSLTNVHLPNVATVDIGAFENCKALTSICLPKATSIDNGAFSSCSSLTTICLPKATSINNGAFRFCSSLTSICLPKDTNLKPTDMKNISVTTLFLCNGSDNTPATEEEAKSWADAISTLTTVFYDYQGEDGDYLDPNNYDQVWTRY